MTQATEPRPPAPAPHLGLGFRRIRAKALADEATRHLLPWARARALGESHRYASNGSNGQPGTHT